MIKKRLENMYFIWKTKSSFMWNIYLFCGMQCFVFPPLASLWNHSKSSFVETLFLKRFSGTMGSLGPPTYGAPLLSPIGSWSARLCVCVRVLFKRTGVISYRYRALAPAFERESGQEGVKNIQAGGCTLTNPLPKTGRALPVFGRGFVSVLGRGNA